MSKQDEITKSAIERSQGLDQSLKVRQIVMAGVGGTIGTGLFLGTGFILGEAGPGGAICAYLFGGIIMWFMMMCLGELSAAMPVSGSMQVYATEFINPAAGFTIGWLNWLGCAITIAAQIVASAIIMQNIIPSVPIFVWLLGFTLLFFGANAMTVSTYGESSFWFSSLKIVLVVAFAIVGIGMITGVVGGNAVGFSNYTQHGGLFPKGGFAILLAMLTTLYSFGGSDGTAIAAGELANKKDVPKAIHLTTWILIGAYMVSIMVLVALFPWTEANLLGSPFAEAFSHAGINSAALIVNLFVLTSALSSGNYFVYYCTRTLWSMAKFDQAPKIFAKVNSKKVPMNALLFSMGFAALSMVANFIAEDTVYLLLISIGAAGNITVYSTICVCQMLFRRRYLANGGDLNDLNFRTPLYPLVPVLGIGSYLLILFATIADPTQRVSIFISLGFTAAMYIVFKVLYKKDGTLANTKNN